MTWTGSLVVDKPAGPTSHDMVNRARRVFRLRRIGHTGTLDPFATGVLPLCLGRATRLARFLGGGEKVYRASVRVGFATSTDDLTGEPLAEPKELHLDAGEVRQALNEFVGTHEQMPPAYSARKVGGRRSYDLARKGEEVPRTARPVTIHAIELLGIGGAEIEIEVRCARGTYIRSLARDLGEALGVGAHLSALRRTRSGSFVLEQAVSGDDLALGRDRLVPLADALPELLAVRVGARGPRARPAWSLPCPRERGRRLPGGARRARAGTGRVRGVARSGGAPRVRLWRSSRRRDHAASRRRAGGLTTIDRVWRPGHHRMVDKPPNPP